MKTLQLIGAMKCRKHLLFHSILPPHPHILRGVSPVEYFPGNHYSNFKNAADINLGLGRG